MPRRRSRMSRFEARTSRGQHPNGIPAVHRLVRNRFFPRQSPKLFDVRAGLRLHPVPVNTHRPSPLVLESRIRWLSLQCQTCLFPTAASYSFVRTTPGTCATARVMRNFGLSDLVLVAPYASTNDLEARRMATHGLAVLDSARVVPELGDALSDCVYSFATSALTAGVYRSGTIGTAAEKMPELLAAEAGSVGCVRPGTARTQQRGDRPLSRSGSRSRRSRIRLADLAQAVAICCYELRKAWSKSTNAARGQPELPVRGGTVRGSGADVRTPAER